MSAIRRILAALVLSLTLTISPALMENASAQETQAAGRIVLAQTRPAESQPATDPAIAATRPAASSEPASVPASGPSSAPATSPATQSSRPPPKDLKECDARFMRGDYAGAADGFRHLMSQESLQVAAATGLSRALGMEGKYDRSLEALKAAEPAALKAGAPLQADWRLAMADALSAVGKYDEALDQATQANLLRPEWGPAILARGAALETLGRKEQAVAVYKTCETVFSGDSYRKDARNLTALGSILDRYSVLIGQKASEQSPNILHNYFQDAYQKVDEKYWPANLAAGMLLLSKYQPNLAMQEFELARKINPRCPDVEVGIGLVALGEWNFEGCLERVAAALKVNPNHADALLLKAACLMQWRKFSQVEAPLRKVLEVNPNNLDALSLMAALHIRMGKADQAQPYIDRVDKINPRCATLPQEIGQWLAAARQFPQAQQQFLKAIELAPELAEPRVSLALLYMETGEEAKAAEIFDKAFAIDDYRRDVINYRRLLGDMHDYQVKETPNFIVKVSKEDAVLLDQVANYMEKIYPVITRDFGHKPPVKTMIEIFPSHQDFSIRITGRGWIGTVGASTGRVIVMAAPSKDRSEFGTYDWATVLRHEFTHTVTLSATENRIPHWFTEACAVWQQSERRGYAAMRQLVDATQHNHLFPVKELDWSFIRPKRGGDRSQAYAQAEWMMEFIIAKKQFDAVPKMLEAFRQGLTQEQVFKTCLGMSEGEFDSGFKAWAREQVKSWGYDPEAPQEVAKATLDSTLHPTDAAAQARLAKAQYLAGKTSDAEKTARKTLQMDANCTMALEVLSKILTEEKHYDEAVDLASRLERIDNNSQVAPRVVARCCLERRLWAQAIEALERLKTRAPLEPYSYDKLAGLYTQLGQIDKALPDLIELNRRTMEDPVYARQVAEIYRSQNKDDLAMDYYEQLMHINPYETSAYQAVASIHLKAKRYDQAIAAHQSICLLQPQRAESWTQLAAVRYRAGRATQDKAQLDLARQDAEKALKLDPNCQAKDIIQMLDALKGD